MRERGVADPELSGYIVTPWRKRADPELKEGQGKWHTGSLRRWEQDVRDVVSDYRGKFMI